MDLIIIGDIEFARVVQALHPALNELARESNPKAFSPSEWRRRIEKHHAFVTDVMARPKILIIGSAHDVGQFAPQKA